MDLRYDIIIYDIRFTAQGLEVNYSIEGAGFHSVLRGDAKTYVIDGYEYALLSNGE